MNKISKTQNKKFNWLNIENVSGADLKKISKIKELELSDIIDVYDPDEVPRLERHGDSLILFIRYPIIKDKMRATELILIILNSNNIYTISKEKNPFSNDLNLRYLVSLSYLDLFLYLLRRINILYETSIKKVRYQVRKGINNMKNIGDLDVINLVEAEETLNQYMSAMVPLKNIYKNLLYRKYLNVTEDEFDKFEDIVIQIDQAIDLCSVNLKSITNIRDASQMLFTNRLNTTVKVFTTFSIILTIPTIVASIYGMNVRLPFAGNDIAFWIILSFSLLLILFSIIFARYKKWM